MILTVVRAGDLGSGESKPKKKGLLIEKRMKTLEGKCESDNLIFARDREDLDAIANERKEDRYNDLRVVYLCIFFFSMLHWFGLPG